MTSTHVRKYNQIIKQIQANGNWNTWEDNPEPWKTTNCLKLRNKFLGKQTQLNKRIHMKELTVRKNGIYLGDGTTLVTDVEKPTIIHILSVRNARKLHLEFSLNANVIDFDQKIKIMMMIII